MIINYGYLGQLNNTDLNTIHGVEHNGIYEINDPRSYSDTYNFPNDYQTLSSFFTRGYKGKTYYDFVKEKGSNVDPASLLKYNLLLAYDHLRANTVICTGILEVTATNNFTIQKFTRIPDGTTFTRRYKNNTWSKWRYVLTTLLNDLLSEDKSKKVAFKPSRITTITNTEFPRFDDKYLWDKVNTKMDKSVCDNLVWNDRPDEVHGITYFGHLAVPYINFESRGRDGDFGIIIQKFEDNNFRGEMWFLRFNSSVGELYIGNEFDDGVRTKMYIKDGCHLWNIQGGNYTGYALYDRETHFNYTGGNGTVVLPVRPQSDIHVFAYNNVFHFIPGVAKSTNYWDNAQYLARSDVFITESYTVTQGTRYRGTNHRYRWEATMTYDGDRTITVSNGRNGLYMDVRWR